MTSHASQTNHDHEGILNAFLSLFSEKGNVPSKLLSVDLFFGNVCSQTHSSPLLSSACDEGRFSDRTAKGAV